MGNRKPQARFNTLSRCLMLSLAVMAGGMTPLMDSHAQTSQPSAGAIEFDIPAGGLGAALDRFAEQSGLQVVSDQSLQGVTTTALRGRYAPEDALRRLLQDSGFAYERLDAQTLVLKKRPVAAPQAPQAGTRSAPATARPVEPEIQELGTLTVTGTRIRGGSTPSPVIRIGSEQIAEEGFTDLGEVIRSIPQNFTGGQNPGVSNGGFSGAGNANQNQTGGSGLNLRGLGPDATLTLLNGRRMVYGGFVNAVDISAIPVEAVDRLEIVPDGASAIYGSDAVGGVGNVILKRDLDGVAIGTRYGSATDGGLTTREYSITAGATWTSGGLIAAYKYNSADPILASKRDYTDFLMDPTTIYPGSHLRSGMLSIHQSIGDNVELRLDALSNQRDQHYAYFYSATNYQRVEPETTTTLVSPSIELSLPNDWSLTAGGAWGKDEHELFSTIENMAIGVSMVGTNDCYCNESRSYEMGGEGPLLSLTGGDVRLAIGVGYRKNELIQANHNTGVNTISADESSRFAYAELNFPLVGSNQSVPGVRRLALTAAIRGEDYSTFGGVSTPKLGLIYGPTADLTVKASWGKSFKAPTLRERYWAQAAYLYRAATLGGTGYPADATALYLFAGNPGLDPERARTWSTSLAFHPEALPGLEAELTWFDVDYTDRVVQAIVGASYSQSLSNPIYAEFVDYSPTPQQQAAVLAEASFYNLSGADYIAGNVVAIVDGRYVNVARQRIKGLDLSGSYRFDLGAGRLTIRGSASWLDSWQQTSSAQNAYDLAGTLFNPPRVTGRVGAVWNHGGLTASIFGNHKGGVTNTVDDVKTASFTTFDATLRYALGDGGQAWSGLELALSVDNLFDQDPPLYIPTSVYAFPYDSTNYPAIGRYLSLSVSKHF